MIKQGLNLSVGGQPRQAIEGAPRINSVAILGGDYPGLRVSMLVSEGERVRLGQPLFVDRHDAAIQVTSAGAGIVAAIHRGARRALEAVVIRLEGDECVEFPALDNGALNAAAPERIRATLLASGLWTALRTRPYGRIPASASTPHALFVTAIDTRPLAPDPGIVIDGQPQAFVDGLTALSRMIGTPIFLCVAPGLEPPLGNLANLTVVEFQGPHPAGLPGTHIHLLAPVSDARTVWYIGYQDVIAIGRLFTTGHVPIERVVSLAGPGVRRPRLVQARLGAALDDLTAGELEKVRLRVFSGCVLSGSAAGGRRPFLGRYHNQVTALLDIDAAQEASRRVGLFRSWSGWTHSRASRPCRRPLIPIDSFERVVPLDILPTPLFRALLAGDVDTAAALGALELEEEDLSLCGFICPSAIDYGALLRDALGKIELQG
jgi:Na+-transporting NADH:ubiquinone oxidoreductase subunit A